MSTIKYLEFRDTENFEFDSDLNNFITFIGKGNDRIIKNLLNINKKHFISIDSIQVTEKTHDFLKRKITFIQNKYLNIFLAETLKDEIAFGLESFSMKKDEMRIIIEKITTELKINHLLEKDPYSLGISDKVKLKIACALVCKPRILVLENILDELDYLDKKLVVKILKNFIKEKNIVLNFSCNIEESLFGNKIIVSDELKILLDGKTISVLNEEKILKRLGLGLPFIIELNKYLMDYEILSKYELDKKKLVDEIWK